MKSRVRKAANIYHLEARPAPSSISIIQLCFHCHFPQLHFSLRPGQLLLSLYIFLPLSFLTFCNPLLAHESACLFPGESQMSLYQKLARLTATVKRFFFGLRFLPRFPFVLPLQALRADLRDPVHGQKDMEISIVQSTELEGLMKMWLPLDQEFPVDLAVHGCIYMWLYLCCHRGQSLHVLHTVESKEKENANRGPWSESVSTSARMHTPQADSPH